MSRRLLGRRGDEFEPRALCSCYDAPQQDPAIGEATRASVELGREQLDLARSQMDRSNALIDRYAPIYDRLLQSNLDAGDELRQRSTDQWNHYEQNFRPLEEQIAREARDYDSEGEIARRTGLAAGTVQTQFDAAQGQNARRMASMGISPTSGRSTQTGIDQANALALAKAGAVNNERNATKMTGMALRQNAAQIGRGLPATSLAASGQGINANQATTGTMGAQTGQMAGALAPAMGMYGSAAGSFGQAGNLGLGSFNAAMQNEYNAANSFSDTLGTIIGAAGRAYSSSKKKKTGVKPINDGAAMQAIRKVPVKSWKYRDGEGDGGSHVGPMAEDMQAAAGNGVAPGGKAIDVISQLGMQQAAIRDLDKRLSMREVVPMRRISSKASEPPAVML